MSYDEDLGELFGKEFSCKESLCPVYRKDTEAFGEQLSDGDAGYEIIGLLATCLSKRSKRQLLNESCPPLSTSAGKEGDL